MLSTDAAADPSRPLLASQVTELADGVFVGMSLSHAAADWTTFWDLFNTWSEISRNKSDISTAAPPLERPVGVRTGPGDKEDGLITVFEAGGEAGGMELEVCLPADVLARLVADEELMSTSV
ncbi:unnamed protein product [Triticum turgidum subsp. durum]|uniref:Acetyltransferase n=1 Tax=Triticum turgidum subsp. durum TaxID=4567 RepID=A0A9R1PBR9_TRITD|nr:unnamed protein product [Triticum turgidum subsp. durum]